MTETTLVSPHDLLLVGDRGALTAPGGGRLSDAAAIAAASSVESFELGAWVVVRRATSAEGMIPVGIRGATRADRFAAEVAASAVERLVSPPQVPRSVSPGRGSLGAFRSLDAVDRDIWTLEAPDSAWGPTGSVGFELATGRPTVRLTSDLDILIDAPKALDVGIAARFLERLARFDCRVDVQVSAPGGAFALGEWVRESGGLIAVRTAGGPLLTDDPWKMDA